VGGRSSAAPLLSFVVLFFHVCDLLQAGGVAASVLMPGISGAAVAALLLGGTFMALTALGLQAARAMAPTFWEWVRSPASPAGRRATWDASCTTCRQEPATASGRS